MDRECLHCGHEFPAETATNAFCATYCEQAWWASSTAGREWPSVENALKIQWEGK